MVELVLFVLGISFGSFVNALVWRLHEQGRKKKRQPDLSIMHGRSMCVHCKHTLHAADLIPILSWLLLQGKCRYCGKSISWQYPLVELAMGTLFVLSYIWWPATLLGGQWLLFVGWLAGSVGLMALLVYDARWFLLPNRIIYPTLLIVGLTRLSYIVFYSDNVLQSLWLWVASLLVASGLFWLLYTISKGKWIGFGDVRLGLITGTVLADPILSWLMIFIASVLGMIVVAPTLLTKNRTMTTKIPYGPYLIIATFLVLLFGPDWVDWYTSLFEFSKLY